MLFGLYGLNDICIVPAAISNINSRSECDPYYEDQFLPLFTAPMSCVINDKNYEIFVNKGINTIIPRNIEISTRLWLRKNTFVALSLDEFEEYFVIGGESLEFSTKSNSKSYICIDIANGHMEKLLDLCKLAKKVHGDTLVLMAGNIANPETYIEYAKAGFDYVRIGIGSGNVCTTSANGGIHYPMASLIEECAEYKACIEQNHHYPFNEGLCFYKRYHFQDKVPVKSIPKIVADGGFKNFDQIIKALALGADYCMLGEIFARTEEACGQKYLDITEEQAHMIDILRDTFPNTKFKLEDQSSELYREYYGMSTKRAQMEMGITDPKKLKTAEGIIKQVTIDYTLQGWIDNFIHYLKSSMSYTGSRNLKEFQKVQTRIMSPQAFNAFYK